MFLLYISFSGCVKDLSTRITVICQHYTPQLWPLVREIISDKQIWILFHWVRVIFRAIIDYVQLFTTEPINLKLDLVWYIVRYLPSYLLYFQIHIHEKSMHFIYYYYYVFYFMNFNTIENKMWLWTKWCMIF